MSTRDLVVRQTYFCLYTAYKIAHNRTEINYRQTQNSKIKNKIPKHAIFPFCFFPDPNISYHMRQDSKKIHPVLHGASLATHGCSAVLRAAIGLRCGPSLLQPICFEADHAVCLSTVICHPGPVWPFSFDLRRPRSRRKLPSSRKGTLSGNFELLPYDGMIC